MPPHDATFECNAPDEPDKTGTVSLEARSKRGGGRASIDFDTKRPAAYQVVGGLDDWQMNAAMASSVARASSSSRLNWYSCGSLGVWSGAKSMG
jgi:hypothetical protein